MIRCLRIACLVLLFLPLLSPAQEVKEGIKEQIESITNILNGMNGKVKETQREVETIKKRKDLSEADQQKIEILFDSSEKTKLDLLNFNLKLQGLRDDLAKQGADTVQLKQTLEQIMALREQLPALKDTVERNAKTPEEFRAFTDFRLKLTAGQARAELEALEDGRTIPLANRKVKASEQSKDGPLELIEVVVSDKDGVVIVPRPDWRNRARPLYVVFEFAGDADNRACRARVKTR